MSTSTTAVAPGLKWIRGLALINLGLLAVEVISAGFLLSGSGPAILVHARGAIGLGLGALVQASTAVVLWRRRHVPASVARAGIVLFVIVVLQMGAGHTKRYWLHVPIGVALFSGLLQQIRRLEPLSAAGALALAERDGARS
jgi:hypothetical protein